jgi:hypothetical protein
MPEFSGVLTPMTPDSPAQDNAASRPYDAAEGRRELSMRVVIIACAALLGVVATPVCAQKGDASAKQKFVVALQNAIRADDKNWLADHMSYPVNYFGKQKVVIRSKTSFINNYASFVTPKLRASVLAQDPADVFENWQGAMIGGGNENIWITQVGDSDNAPYQIITINDAGSGQ